MYSGQTPLHLNVSTLESVGENKGFLMRIFLLLLALALTLGTISCGDDTPVGAAKAGRIQVIPNPIAFAQVNIGESEELAVSVSNQASQTLTVFEMRLEARDGGSISGLELINAPTGEFRIEGQDAISFVVRYTPQEGVNNVRGKLVFVSSDDRYSRESPLVVNVDTLGNQPRLQLNPSIVRFTRQSPGARETQKLGLRNIGSAPLVIWSEPSYGGGQDFRLTVPSKTYPFELPIFDADAAISNPGDYEMILDVEYAPLGNGLDSGEIFIITNDRTGQNTADSDRFTTIVEVAANADAPCILVNGTTRNFGQVPIGGAGVEVVVVSNCGTQNLEISSIRLTRNSPDNEFNLELGGLDANRDGELDTLLVLRPAEERTFAVKYTPAQEGSDTGTIIIGSNDPVQPELELSLIARGSNGVCPIASAGAYIRGGTQILRQSMTAAPLQYIVLDGSASRDEDGRVVEYFWEFVRTPPGVSPQLTPTQQDPQGLDGSKREFRLLTAGVYEIELSVRDNDGFMSCEPAKVSVVAIPNEKILIELTWTNPEDPDETDNIGSDVDIHLVKMGPGKWFEAPYDIYFRNPESNWGPETPSLDIDDRDGLGPENIQMNDPANCEWYAIGAHYYKQLFGTAYVTVRVYINSALVFEKINKPMTRGGQFWDVARIHWDSGQVYEVDNLLEAAPTGSAPAVHSSMQNSGLCTNQNLYPIQ